MNDLAIVGISISGVVGIALFLFHRSFSATRRGGAGKYSGSTEIRAEKYEPMGRVLATEEFAFLRTQPGCTPEMEKKFVAARRQVMREYLTDLKRDFDACHQAASDFLLMAPTDQPLLAEELLRQRWYFQKNYVLAHVSLTMSAVGLSTVRTEELVKSIATVRRHFDQASDLAIAGSVA